MLERITKRVGNSVSGAPVSPAPASPASSRRTASVPCPRVDPLLGGDQALVELVEAAHARGLKVMGDLTANHSGAAHEWFRRALAEPDSPEAGYY